MKATPAGAFRNRFSFEKRAAGDDGYGNTQAAWAHVFDRRAKFHALKGGESVIAARMASRVPAILTIRKDSATVAIDAAWRCIDRETGTIYEIRTVTPPGDRPGELDLLIESGNSAGAAPAVPAPPAFTTANPFVTNDATPSVAGTAETGAIVTVLLDGVAQAPVYADPEGGWSYTFAALADGEYGVTAMQEAGGYQSAPSPVLEMTIDAEVDISGTPVTDAIVGESYSFTPSASGGVPPYAFSLAGGTLPDGLTLDSETGEISGTPTTPVAAAGIVIRVTDSESSTADLPAFTLTVRGIWTPLSDAAALGLKNWWDGTDAEGITLDGSQNISAWEDRVSGVVATQSSAGNRPGYNAAGYLDNAATARWLDIPYMPTGNTHKWALHVMAADVSGATQGDGSFWAINGYSGGVGMRQPMAAYARTGTKVRPFWDVGANVSFLEFSPPDDDWHLMLTRLDGGVHKASVNGAAEAVGTAVALPASSATQGRIGDFRWTTNSNGLIAWKMRHLLIGTVEPTDDLRDKLQGWAAWEAGLEALLPADHPYKSQRPLVSP